MQVRRKVAVTSPNSISDEELLSLMMRGYLKGRKLNSDPEIKMYLNVLKKTICGTEGDNGTRYRIEIRYEGRKRSIVLAKLVWMLTHLRVVPEGYEIHHKDWNRYNDCAYNLQLLTAVDHAIVHYQHDEEWA